MKRRDLIKAGLVVAGAAALGACSKQESAEENIDLIPKQTGTYEFSVPMPLDYKVIDSLAALNKKYKKSQVVTLYNNVPFPLTEKWDLWFQINRGENPNIRSYQDFFKYARYAQDKGFKICYLMNSSKVFSEKNFNSIKSEFYKILNLLQKNHIDEIKFANTQVATLINESKYKFKLSSSTAAEYNSVEQYQNLAKNFDNVKFADVAIDQAQNFGFLRNLRKALPDMKLELMINEYCLKGCPSRISHVTERYLYTFNCHRLANEDEAYFLIKSSAIYPWNLEYYSAIGINNFKYVATQNDGMRSNYHNLKPMDLYLGMVEYGIENYTAKDFFNGIYFKRFCKDDRIRLKEVIPYLPDIKHFVKYGDKCATRCGVDCDYCQVCAKYLNRFLGIG